MRIPLPGIKYFTGQNDSFLKNLIEFGYFSVKRNKWMLDPTRYWKDFKGVEIDRPVFVLGLEGGGLTLIARMIRRNKNFVAVSGNYKNWTGPDEMQLVLGPILPPQFTGRRYDLPKKLQELRVNGNRIYASNEFIDYYRKTEEDVTPQLKKKFRKIIRWLIAKQTVDKKEARFIDKSQGFTVKVSFINEILKDTDPKFVLVTRDPYATAFKFAKANVKNYTDKIGAGYKKTLKMSSQHWKNSMKYALEDGNEVKSFFNVKFEDILSNPEQEMKKVCDFIEIDFDKDLLPQPEHKIPFGSKGKEKWYPLRPDVNQKYFDKMNQKDVEVIDRIVGSTARKLGYSKPDVT